VGGGFRHAPGGAARAEISTLGTEGRTFSLPTGCSEAALEIRGLRTTPAQRYVQTTRRRTLPGVAPLLQATAAGGGGRQE